jgi:hypothetical protein
VNENAGQVEVQVQRLGDTAIGADIDYSTRSVTASDRSDFTAAAGRLHFAPSETSKSFFVLINNDLMHEDQEFAQLILDDPSAGATVDLAQLMITDDDVTSSATNAVDVSELFVRQHYHDFLNREPDATGLAFWIGEIELCQQIADPQARANCTEVKRTNVSASFFLSIEFQQTGYLVYRMYRAAFPESAARPRGLPRLTEFKRDAQEVGRGVVVGEPGWQTKLEQNKQALFANFVQRREFLTLFPETLTPELYVDALFRTAGLTPSPSERQLVVDEFLNPSGARARALRRVAENENFTRREFNSAFVLMEYFGYLRRNPDDQPDSSFSGYDFWLAKLNQFNGDFVKAEMVKAFLISREYRMRFGAEY